MKKRCFKLLCSAKKETLKNLPFDLIAFCEIANLLRPLSYFSRIYVDVATKDCVIENKLQLQKVVHLQQIDANQLILDCGKLT